MKKKNHNRACFDLGGAGHISYNKDNGRRKESENKRVYSLF